MKKTRLLAAGVAGLLAALLDPALAVAQTFVSSGGNDINPCTAALPCVTFQRAHNVTGAGGQVSCLDAGDFGGAAITQSITIDCAGTLGATSSTGFTVNGTGIVVKLRNLTLNGLGTGTIGVLFTDGSALFVENCAILGFNGGASGQGIGIKFAPSAGFPALFVKDSAIDANGRASDGGGIIIQPSGGSARVTIEATQVLNNTYGIFANGTGTTGQIAMQVRDTTVSGSAFDGISAFTNGAITSITTDRTSSVLNGQAGILSQGSGGFVLLGDSTVMSNTVGLSPAGGGAIYSYQNNHLTGNVTDGAPTSVMTVR